MSATGYTWKGDVIAPAGTVYCLYTVEIEHTCTIMLNEEDSLKGGVRVGAHVWEEPCILGV